LGLLRQVDSHMASAQNPHFSAVSRYLPSDPRGRQDQ